MIIVSRTTRTRSVTAIRSAFVVDQTASEVAAGLAEVIVTDAVGSVAEGPDIPVDTGGFLLDDTTNNMIDDAGNLLIYGIPQPTVDALVDDVGNALVDDTGSNNLVASV